MVAEKVSAHAKLTEKQVSYEEIMNPKKDSEEKGE
jgi:trigger factor